jgi:hypothetical protein
VSSRHKEMRGILRGLRKQGYVIAVSGGNHYRIEHPDMAGPVFTSTTPSSFRHKQYLLAALKRARRTNDA